MEKDFISIGGIVGKSLGMNPEKYGDVQEPDYYEKLGYDVYKFIKRDCPDELVADPYRIAKQIGFGLYGTKLFKYAVDHIDDINEYSCVDIIEDDARCSYALYNDGNINKEYLPGMIRDLTKFADKFVAITGLDSMKPGAGKALLTKIIEYVDDRYPILTDVGCGYAGDFYMELKGTLEKNIKVFLRAGFRDVNRVIGNYNFRIVMLRSSDELYNEIMKSRSNRGGA